MSALEPGQIAPLAGSGRESVVVDVSWAPAGVSADIYAFLSDARGRPISTEHVVFAARPDSPEGAVFLRSQANGGVVTRAQVQIDLTAVPAAADHVLCVLAVTAPNSILEPVSDMKVHVWSPVTGGTDATFEVKEGGVNKCMLLGLVQRAHGGWSFHALGRGFEGDIIQFANRGD